MNTFISLVKVLLLSKFRTKLPQATENTCIVLGNGPSLNDSLQKHPDFFKKHPLICVNSFSVTELYTQLQPTYYVILDPGFWLSNNDLINNTIDCIKKKTTWPVHLLVPPQAAKSELFAQLENQNPNIKINYFNYTVFKGFNAIAYYFYKRNLAILQSQNVLVASLFLAVNIGFKNIYLFGADHTWHQTLHVNDENVLCVKHVHFYESEEKINYTPFYKGLHKKDETFKMHEILITLGKTFYGYIAINEYAKHQNCIIYNTSEISFIDAFERIKL